ncbi:Uncharacterised protein [Burkholderia pseudomallei]|nr:Uncharacterised protein [Burkholderia pseudomallei]
MAIPEAQLETWSRQGAIQSSSDTYQAVKRVLESEDAPYRDNSYEVFLQGSYANDTNVYAESDVDIVIRLDDCFHSDLESLTEAERVTWRSTYVDATYTYPSFKRDVIHVLRKMYGDAVHVGNKAISIDRANNRRKADVLVTTAFRRYFSFDGMRGERYQEGVCFFDANGERIENYPKAHSANLTSRHQQSGRWLKPTIRMLKNMRSRLVELGCIQATAAPSYYLEGLLYNVPNDKFGGNLHECFVNAFTWIQQANKAEFLCANEQFYLLRDNAHTCWSTRDGQAFIDAVIELWNNW